MPTRHSSLGALPRWRSTLVTPASAVAPGVMKGTLRERGSKMKIGRNDPCPCGSGKKYKKCCVDGFVRNPAYRNTTPIEDSPSDYGYMCDTAKRLEQIITLYNIGDVTRAIFCINSWTNNRSAVAQSLTLNQAMINVKVFGDKSIKEYRDLKAFFDAIIPDLQITSREDLTLNDFGEVKIIVNRETYPIILGTGHEHVYAVMKCLPVLAEVVGMTDDLKAVLYYNREIIDALAESNISSSDEEYDIMFELPSESFWQAVNRLFDSPDYLEHAKRAFEVMGYQRCPIEMRHFLVYMGDCYPLYNTSILVDLYKKLLSLATKEEYQRHINLTIGRLIENIFNFSDNTRSPVLLAPKIIDKDTGEPHTNNRLLFMTVSRNRVLIALNKGDFYDDDSIIAEIGAIKSLHERNQLRLGETYYRAELNGGYAADVLANMTIEFLLVEPFTDITAHGRILGSIGELFSCSVLDLIYFMCFMDDFDELLEFIEYERKEEAQIMAFGGNSSLFFTWKNMHRQIASGATDYSFISVSYGTADDYVFHYYTTYLLDYPFGRVTKMFMEPCSWRIKESDFGYSYFEHKGCLGFVGKGKFIGSNTFLFLAHNVEFFTQEDFMQKNDASLRIVDELNQRLFNRYGEALEGLSLLNGKTLQVMFMPMHYARKVDHVGFTQESSKEYVYSDIYVDTDTVIIRFTVDVDALLSALINSSDKGVECTYFLELIHPMGRHSPASFAELEKHVMKDSLLKKEVAVFTIEQDYYYSEMSPSNKMEALNFVRARKEIAKVCFSAGVEPGEYGGKVATQVIRQMQTAIVKVFEDQISQYNQEKLHRKALNYYATQLQGIIINHKRYSTFTDLDPGVQQEFEEKTRNIREECRRNLRTAQYLLESNLATQHQDSTHDCDKNEFENLLAFADWLVVLQDNADSCHYSNFDVSITIDREYKLDTILAESSEKQYEQILLRKYNNQGKYTIENDEKDKEYLMQCASAFLTDTGIDFGTLISLLEYLQLDVVKKAFVEEVYPNVFECSKHDLINDFLEVFIEPNGDDREQVERALDFVTLDFDKLKVLSGVTHDILPIWDREKRDNRFDVKPIVLQEGTCIFSPVVMKQLATMWKSGFVEWYLPFELGLESVKIELAKWKRRYEDKMVLDIASVFQKIGFHPVLVEVKLASRYPQCGFPDDLGDYDVIAVSQSKRKIWLIESKVLQNVGSIYEDQMQQQSFFYPRGQRRSEDEKFQRRIDFVTDSLNEVLSAMGIEATDYRVVPYMVTNKLFTSRYKKLCFPIISYHELLRKLEYDQLE